jgi:hypothetical protein
MSPATIATIGVTLLGVFALWRFGAWEERLVGAMVVALLGLVHVVEPFQIGTWRAGVAALELTFLIAVWTLVYRRDRWWLTALTGFQLISVLTHVTTLLAPHHFVWTAVTVRLGVWLLICVTFFAGAWEAWADRRFAREGQNHEPLQTQPVDI